MVVISERGDSWVHFWTLKWPESATQIEPPASTAIPAAVEKLNLPLPLAPNWPRYLPPSPNSSTRLFFWSPTQMLPEESASIATGALNSPPPLPSLPTVRTRDRLEFHCWMRLLPVSATQIEPSGATAI